MKPKFSAVRAALFLALAAPGVPASAQPGAPTAAPAAPNYAEIADLTLASPVVIDASIRSAARIKGAEAASVAPGFTRFYVEADVIALVRAPAAVPPRVGWLVDVPNDFAGRAPKLKKLRVLAFARPVAGRAGQVQLVTVDGQRAWTPALDALVRTIVRDSVAQDAPPVVTGIGNAFHVAGSLPGEGETQIFLTTANAQPVSLSVLRRPGEQPRFAVALGEIVDDAAAAPARDTLLWYRLACALPATLPATALADLATEDARQARDDYRFVLERLGPCGRPPAR